MIFFSLPKRNGITWKSKHVFITGGSKGIGKQLAFELLRRGCSVTIAARNKKALEEAREEMVSFGRSVGNSLPINTVVLDVTSSYNVIESVMEKVESDIGPVDVLINNAGTAEQGAFEDLQIENFEAQMRLNFLGAVYVTRAVIKKMKDRGYGHIGFVCSAAGQFPLWGYTAYGASKYALRGFAEALFMEMLPYNIGVSVLYPPNTDTEGFKKETLTAPPQVAEITKTAGLFTPDIVAGKYVDGIENGEFCTTIGFEGWMLGLTTAGCAQEPCFVQALYQVLLAGWLRGIVLIYIGYFNMIVKKLNCRRK